MDAKPGSRRLIQVDWSNQPLDAGSPVQQRALQAARRALDHALTTTTRIKVSSHWSPNTVWKAIIDVAHREGLKQRTVPMSAGTLNAAFRDVSRFRNVQAVLRFLEYDDEATSVVVRELEQAAAGGPEHAHLRDPAKEQGFQRLRNTIEQKLSTWLSAEPGTDSFQRPDLTLGREILDEALPCAQEGRLDREYTAFCLYSACVNTESSFLVWAELAPSNSLAAEWLLDLVLLPRSRMVRPGIRAALALERMDPLLRTVTVEEGLILAEKLHDGTAELLRAIDVKGTLPLIEQRLGGDFYQPDEAAKIANWLETLLPARPLLTARGRVTAAYARVLEQAETSTADGTEQLE